MLDIFSSIKKTSMMVTLSCRSVNFMVSIVVPCYNRNKYIKRALQSAMKQTLQKIEILVVDDGSTDSSMSIVEGLQKQDKRIRIVRHSVNLGTHAARMTGAVSASGRYILSFDPDDLLVPTIAEHSLQVALRESADVVEFQAHVQYWNRTENFTFLEPTFDQANRSVLVRAFSAKELNWNLWKRLIRRDVYEEAVGVMMAHGGQKRIVYAEDKLHWGTIVLFTQKFVFLRELGYIYFCDNPDNSESETQQTMIQCLRQLKSVELTLKAIYKEFDVKYKRTTGVPKGFQERYSEMKRQKMEKLIKPTEQSTPTTMMTQM